VHLVGPYFANVGDHYAIKLHP